MKWRNSNHVHACVHPEGKSKSNMHFKGSHKNSTPKFDLKKNEKRSFSYFGGSEGWNRPPCPSVRTTSKSNCETPVTSQYVRQYCCTYFLLELPCSWTVHSSCLEIAKLFNARLKSEASVTLIDLKWLSETSENVTKVNLPRFRILVFEASNKSLRHCVNKQWTRIRDKCKCKCGI
jgi:hypothetical protein